MKQLEIKIPTKKDLLETFEKIKNIKHEGVRGVLRFDSGNSGPALGITIQTHGNEPSGLAVLWYFLNISPIQELLQKGSIFFVINNIKATEKYFLAKTDEERQASRFIDVNFNRLPKDVMTCNDDTNYEVCRAQKLKKIWQNFDVGLDVHSTAQDSKPMIIAINKFEKELVKGFPIEIIISNIENIQIGIPPTVFYGGKRTIPVICIEAGTHERDDSFKTAITCVLRLMQNLQMTSCDKKMISKQEYSLYEVVDSLVFPDDSYFLSKIYPMFTSVSKGDIIGVGNNGSIYAPVSGCTVFGPKQVKPNNIKEEVLFFTKPSRKLLV